MGSEADDDGGADAAAAANGDGPPSVASTLKTSTTITRVVDYIGRRMQEVHSEMQSPRRCASSHSAGFDDPQNVPRAQQVVFPPSRPTHTGCCEGPLDASSSASGSLTARSGNKTARQIEAKNSGTFPFLFARVVDEPDPEPDSEPETEPGPESGSAAESEALDYMNQAVPMFTGDKEVSFPSGYDNDAKIVIQQTQPLPMTVLAIMRRSNTFDA